APRACRRCWQTCNLGFRKQQKAAIDSDASVVPRSGAQEMQTVPPAVARVYTTEVVQLLAGVERHPAHPADHEAEPIRQRHVIFSVRPVSGRAFGALRVAWWRYIEHADAVGLLDEDLLQRLRSTDDDDFRGALAECRTSSFFAENLHVGLHRHVGSGGDF